MSCQSVTWPLPGQLACCLKACHVPELMQSNQAEAQCWLVHVGGTVLASNAIHEEVVRFKATGKPVVASMGNMAASAGYDISGQRRCFVSLVSA